MIECPVKRNANLRCFFHKDHGYKIEHCKALKAHLEELVKAGHLSEYVDHRKTKEEGVKAPLRPDNVLEDDDAAYMNVLHAINVIRGASNPSALTGKQLKIQVKQATAALHAFQIDPTKKSRKRAPAEEVDYKKLITFSNEDLEGVHTPHHDALVLTLRVANWDIDKILLDHGSSSEVMYLKTFKKMGLTESDLKEAQVSLIGFSEKLTMSVGKDVLPVRVGNIKIIKFLVVDIESQYHAIFGRGWLHAMKDVPSSYHQKIKYVTDEGVMVLRGSQVSARQCFIAVVRPKVALVASSETPQEPDQAR